MRIELTHAEVLRDDVIVNASLNLAEGKKENKTKWRQCGRKKKKGGGIKKIVDFSAFENRHISFLFFLPPHRKQTKQKSTSVHTHTHSCGFILCFERRGLEKKKEEELNGCNRKGGAPILK